MNDFDKRLSEAKEPEVEGHQHQYEAVILSTLAAHINEADQIALMIIGNLRGDGFLQRSDHRDIYSAMRMLHDQGDHVDASTVKEWIAKNQLKTTAEDVDAIFGADAAGEGQVRTYLDRITSRGKIRLARDMASDVLSALEDQDANVDEAVAKLQSIAFDMAKTRRIVGETVSDADAVDGLVERLKKNASDKGFVGLDTGFDYLNNAINGLNSRLYIFAGSPSSGKTTFLKQMADQVAEKTSTPVLFFSFEQSRDELMTKTLGRLSQVNTRDIVKGRVDVEGRTMPNGAKAGRKAWSSIEAARDQYKTFGHHIKVIEADHDTTVERIRIIAQAARQQSETGKVLIIVDYLQAMPTSESFGSVKEKVDYLCSELRRLARDLDSPVAAISSMNRAAYSNKGGKVGKPTMDSFKESGGIEYAADVAGAFWTDPDEALELNERAVSLIILKNRNGELPEIKTVFRIDTATFTEQDSKSRSYTDSLKGEEL